MAVSRLSRAGAIGDQERIGRTAAWEVRGCRVGVGFRSWKHSSVVAPVQCGSACRKVVLNNGIVSQGLGSTRLAERGKPLTPLPDGSLRAR